jgi:hypothetical protein
VLSAGLLLMPLIFALIAFAISGRGHWATPLLVAPALLLGLPLAAALSRDAAGPGALVALIYVPVLLSLGGASIIRWHRRRA